MAWFGILSGSAINFLSIYAARLGASGFEIGLLGATTGMVNLVLAIPASRILERRPVGKTVFWTSILYRIGYFLWIPLPWIFGHQGQVWALIGLTLLMGIPLTVLSVGFSALFAEAVSPDWRAYVAGFRNIIYSLTYVVSALGSGWLLDRLPFPAGYQVVFGIGGIGALLSSLHLYFIRTRSAAQARDERAPIPASRQPSASPGWRAMLRFDVWRTPYAVVLVSMLALHLTQYLPIPIFPLYNVNALLMNDQQIGIGTALFYLTCLVGSTQLNRVVRRLGHHKVTALGFMSLSLYPFLMGFSHTAFEYYLVSAIGGLAWSMVGGAYANYILENIPENDRPAYLAWYNIVLNVSILAGSLLGPAIAQSMGIGRALVLFGVLRLLAGTSILKWGQPSRLPVRESESGLERGIP